MLLQEVIIEIALYYRSIYEIYFPFRFDQRGRFYCSPSFFNYQSNELSRALLLFTKPGIMHRKDKSSVLYLKMFGANTFSSVLPKKSNEYKNSWVDKNIDNIINYENGILLEKAKEKYLFLAFCMEFKRFYNFCINETVEIFNTYLPIQLDATCIRFIHMALLSDESSLFKELNLKSVNNTN